jgi:hypothetical protein
VSAEVVAPVFAVSFGGLRFLQAGGEEGPGKSNPGKVEELSATRRPQGKLGA